VQAFNLNDDESSIVHLDLLHQIVPSPVNLFEFLTLLRHLFKDISRIENWFEVHPDRLQFQPEVKVDLSCRQLIFEFLNLSLEFLGER
jgi:hypothetical protein